MEENLKKWAERVIQRRPELGGMSICPFAKKGLKENKIHFFKIYASIPPQTWIMGFLTKLNELDDFDLAIFYDVEKVLTNDDLYRIIKDVQPCWPDIVLLKDHPDDPGFINGIYTGNGAYPIILAQPKSKLLESREILKKTKYYDYWSEEYKNEIWSYGSES